MIRKILLSALAALLLAAPVCSAVEIVPAPVKLSENGAQLRIGSRLSVYACDGQLQALVSTWAQTLEKGYAPGIYDTPEGFRRIVSDRVLPRPQVVGKAGKADLTLSLDGELAEEEYRLDIDRKGIELSGGSVKGVWWGLQSLTQILLQGEKRGNGLLIAGCSIEDRPHFAYRGAMLDCCRHFFSVEEVKDWIDILAFHKLNTFHWHLTEDQGWRIEIKRYPLLTEVGSVRKETKIGHYFDKEKGYDGRPYGGFYTQDEIRDIVAYATARQITVIPEIEMPGHAVAALACYPELGCTGGPYEVRTTWGISEDVFCLGKESTFEFLQNVLDEVCELFPGEYIHIGGDEAPRLRWKSCPHCQAKMKELGLTSEAQLQSYQLQRIESYLNAKGRKVIGWDEILEGGVTPSATVMSWRGPKGGIAAAKLGNGVVMAPNSHFYLDYYQTGDHAANGEPLAIGGHLPLSKCYSFDPYDKLNEREKACIKGIQANTWCEYIGTMDHVQHMDLPRFAALSEVSWSEVRDSYANFVSRVAAALVPVYEYRGFIYSDYAFRGLE